MKRGIVMNNFPPNLDPKLYNISSILIGLALIQNFTASEQNAIGNWFMTIGQILENNAAWQQVIEQRITGNTLNINSKKYKDTGNPYMDNEAWVESPDDKEINNIKRVIEIMQEQLKELQQQKKNF